MVRAGLVSSSPPEVSWVSMSDPGPSPAGPAFCGSIASLHCWVLIRLPFRRTSAATRTMLGVPRCDHTDLTPIVLSKKVIPFNRSDTSIYDICLYCVTTMFGAFSRISLTFASTVSPPYLVRFFGRLCVVCVVFGLFFKKCITLCSYTVPCFLLRSILRSRFVNILPNRWSFTSSLILSLSSYPTNGLLLRHQFCHYFLETFP